MGLKLSAAFLLLLLAACASAQTMITNCLELQDMNLDLAGNYALANDINCSETLYWNGGAGFDPVGNNLIPFSGRFDGQGYQITALTIYRPTEDYLGLFGATSSPATVISVGVLDCNVLGKYYVGGLLGFNNGTLSNCYATGSVRGLSNNVGGLSGLNAGTLTNSYAMGSVRGGGYYVGGLVGYSNGTLSNCYAAGTSDGRGLVYSVGILSNGYWDSQLSEESRSPDGGATSKTTAEMYQQATFAGWDFDCTWMINEGNDYPRLTQADCSSRVVIASTCDELQIAVTATDASISLAQDIDCSATASWNDGTGFLPGTGLSLAGSFNGNGYSISDLRIHRPTTSGVGLFAMMGPAAEINFAVLLGGSILGRYYVGALVGRNAYGTINQSNTTLDVTGEIDVGGLVGSNSGTISNSHATGVVAIPEDKLSNINENSALGGMGGLVGYNAGTITSSSAVGSVICLGQFSSGNNYFSFFSGGLVGINYGSISSSHAIGSVTIGDPLIYGKATGRYAGGLVGRHSQGAISNSYATGNVSGYTCIGGLVGVTRSADIQQCYASGNILGKGSGTGVGSSRAGGLVGCAAYGTISNSYAIGAVSGAYDIGGLVGSHTEVLLTHCYAAGCVYAKSVTLESGGLVGSRLDSQYINQCYWDTATTQQKKAGGRTSNFHLRKYGKATAILYQQATYADWDFENIWDIQEGNSYPFLRNTNGKTPIAPTGHCPTPSTITEEIIIWFSVGIASLAALIMIFALGKHYATFNASNKIWMPLVAYLFEIADKIFDLFLVNTLINNNQFGDLGRISAAALGSSYFVALLGLCLISPNIKWCCLLPVLSPELNSLLGKQSIVTSKFGYLKLANFIVEDLVQFSVCLVFISRKGVNAIVVMKLIVGLLVSIFLLIKFFCYDLPRSKRSKGIQVI